MRQVTRADVLALAHNACEKCGGSGLAPCRTRGHKIGLCGPKVGVCSCVSRAIFRICYTRQQQCEEKISISSSAAERMQLPRRLGPWGRKNEEYLADFDLLVKHALTKPEYRVFRAYFYVGWPWDLCMREFNLDRGKFYRVIYKAEEKAGEAFLLTEPYGIYPLDEYFHSTRERRREEFTEKEWPKPGRWDRRPIVPPMSATRGDR